MGLREPTELPGPCSSGHLTERTDGCRDTGVIARGSIKGGAAESEGTRTQQRQQGRGSGHRRGDKCKPAMGARGDQAWGWGVVQSSGPPPTSLAVLMAYPRSHMFPHTCSPPTFQLRNTWFFSPSCFPTYKSTDAKCRIY